jgi:hypothetical protein
VPICRACSIYGWTPGTTGVARGGKARQGKARTGSNRLWGGPSRRSKPSIASSAPGSPTISHPSRSTGRSTCPPPGFTCSRGAGWWKGPSHSTYNPLLTPKSLPPMIGLTGLLNLLVVVTRLQAAQQDCARAPQEAGVPCLSSPPDQTIWPALPPAFEGANAQSLGPVAAGQSAPTPPSARSTRRTAVEFWHHAAPRQPRGGPA